MHPIPASARLQIEFASAGRQDMPFLLMRGPHAGQESLLRGLIRPLFIPFRAATYLTEISVRLSLLLRLGNLAEAMRCFSQSKKWILACEAPVISPTR